MQAIIKLLAKLGIAAHVSTTRSCVCTLICLQAMTNAVPTRLTNGGTICLSYLLLKSLLASTTTHQPVSGLSGMFLWLLPPSLAFRPAGPDSLTDPMASFAGPEPFECLEATDACHCSRPTLPDVACM